ncbi:polysaccharide biosynthesis/export family protein [Kaistia adipata]|uniref:polysaccharide biosynthesis/export family protein n=1 Tax=Kaistia adipata TaxID=166954 RepID=UPI000A024986|nr:polysaccharide biosynthesis/export family protein [Kaistia adipata]
MSHVCRTLALMVLCAGAFGPAMMARAEVPASSKAGANGTSFPLASGDTLKFDILDDDRDPIDLQIADDGTIQAPYLGAVPVAGLSVADARERLKARYVEQKIFVAPQIGLSVAAYRPIFVIGDVKMPGGYPFQPDLTVEKAIALAGGRVLAGESEDPAMARSRLRGELAKLDAVIIREALSVARLTAQLDDRDAIEEDDIPAHARAYLEGSVADTMRKVEQRLLETDRSGFQAQKAVLVEGVAEAERGQELLKELGAKVNESIDMSRAELERGRILQQRGIKTLTDVTNLERQLNTAEARQLQVMSDASDGRRELGALKQQLSGLEQARKVQALTDLQSHNAELAASLASRGAYEEQLMLTLALPAAKLREAKKAVLDFVVRRKGPDGIDEMVVEPSSPIEPGDVVSVSIRTPQQGVLLDLLQSGVIPPIGGELSQ